MSTCGLDGAIHAEFIAGLQFYQVSLGSYRESTASIGEEKVQLEVL